MSFFKKLSRKDAPKPAPEPERTAEEMRADPELIQIFDEYGRELFVDRATCCRTICASTGTMPTNSTA